MSAPSEPEIRRPGEVSRIGREIGCGCGFLPLFLIGGVMVLGLVDARQMARVGFVPGTVAEYEAKLGVAVAFTVLCAGLGGVWLVGHPNRVFPTVRLFAGMLLVFVGIYRSFSHSNLDLVASALSGIGIVLVASAYVTHPRRN